MFSVTPEKDSPRLIMSTTFVFALTVSLICPVIFIMGNKKMRRRVANAFFESLAHCKMNQQMSLNRVMKRTKIGVRPLHQNEVNP